MWSPAQSRRPLVQVVDGLQLYIKEVADFAVRVGGVSDAVKLKIDVAQSGECGGAAKLFALANSMPLDAACTLCSPLAAVATLQGSAATAWARRQRTARSSAAWA